jgi:hypothetical protein
MLPVLMLAVVVAASLSVSEPVYTAEPAATPANAEIKPATPAASATSSAVPTSPSEADAREAAAPEPAGGAKEASSKGPSPQRFTPSEQVRADFDVSFPIDI